MKKHAENRVFLLKVIGVLPSPFLYYYLFSFYFFLLFAAVPVSTSYPFLCTRE